MDGHNLHTVRELIVGDHHLSATAMIEHRHHGNMTKGGMIVIAFSGLAIDAFGHFFRNPSHSQTKFEMVGVDNTHASLLFLPTSKGTSR